MLKALELVGFKSFADKTRFEFPAGITVIVGPNGSGKSNVVDAVRWVLGEQSAKSLRGTEMADVIFKGTGTGQRKPANAAEVTIIFDNEQRLLGVDSSEVRVSRRVYRSGEGEYLINGEPCRLRDVKDLFRGTGVGTDAYSLIEQGKVDTLLQASPRDRRAIFEEAAGISRFRAKKIESQRRLDRVQQNLWRLSDIVQEVERRLRSLRSQATKARRYQEYTDRLKQLRTHVALSDYRQISGELAEVETQVAELGNRLEAAAAVDQETEDELASLEAKLAARQVQIREIDHGLAKNRETIASHEAGMQLRRQTLQELESEEERCRRQLATLCSRAGNVRAQMQQAQLGLASALAEENEIRGRADSETAELDELVQQLREQRIELQQQRQHHAAQLQDVNRLGTELSGLESKLNVAADAIARDTQRDEQLQEQWATAVQQHEKFDAQATELREQLDRASREQERAQAELDARASNLSDLRGRLAERQQLLTAATERAKVLEEVERRLEGIGAGTKDLLSRAKNAAAGPLSDIRGIVADLIEVKVEMAPLIDAALGDRSQFVVVAGRRVMQAVADGSLRLRGRVGLVALDSFAVETSREVSVLGRQEGVWGRAMDYVQVDPAWNDLVEFLLGSTWIVDSLKVALRLRDQHAAARGRPPRFVTRAGEVLEADGTLCGGPRQSTGGLVSRRSELRALRIEILQHTGEARLLEEETAKLEGVLLASRQRILQWSADRKEASDAYAEAHARAEAARQWATQTKAAYQTLQEELAEQHKRRQEFAIRQSIVLAQRAELEKVVAAQEEQLGLCQSRITGLEGQRPSQEERLTTTKIELAKIEQRVETLRMQALRWEQDNDERGRAIRELRQQLDHCQTRQRETSRGILRASAVVADFSLRQEESQRQLQQARAEQEEILGKRKGLLAQAKTARERAQAMEQARHALQLQAGQLRLKRDGVAERVRDDYGIELGEIEDEQEDEGQRGEIDQEIQELRRKISNIGAVNMESLAELTDLEERFGVLSNQYTDLVNAKESLEKIIGRINADSRRMFVETLEAIRESFQLLFRRAFGGGQADIVVEEDVDLLDAGIEIVATPPGKHSLNISLLSGGERALTAVTLLLAIFRYRPSPFCVLDEVDGPLDEANIDRFVDVLEEFLDQTKVAIVTHSKKTMACATTLYGVTMQESGVSKRVSVQFNDVSEDGSIHVRADQQEDSTDGEAA